jgi:hypothetical protein
MDLNATELRVPMRNASECYLLDLFGHFHRSFNTS